MGGTFTDAVAVGPDGSVRASKAPTTADGVTGVVEALVAVAAPDAIDAFAFGSTVATNALAQRRLASTGLLTTAGFRDVLDVRRLWRPQLFGHAWTRPGAIVPRRLRLEARERIDWRGRVVEPLVLEDVEAAAIAFAAERVEAVAVSFLFSYLEPRHERQAGALLRELLPGVLVLESADVNPERKEYERTSTTAIAAGLAPVVGRALGAIEDRLRAEGVRPPLRVLRSNGGVMPIRAARERPAELVKSGPAGGVSAGLRLAEELGEANAILLDIGGTTADVSVIIEGQAATAASDAVEWDIPVRVPVVDIRSIGSGGGSIVHLDAAGGLHVGPRSAGAEPGPAAYGHGGLEPTLTDAAVVAGWLDPARFLGGAMPLDAAAAATALEPVAAALSLTLREAAAAALHVAVADMATLVRELTIERGHDPRGFPLIAFGGAGPLLLSALLEELELGRGVVPARAATFSALGAALADVVLDLVRSESDPARLGRAVTALHRRAAEQMAEDGFTDAVAAASADLRYAGQWHELAVPVAEGDDFGAAAGRFEAEHERLFGHVRPEDPIELVAVRVRATAAGPRAAGTAPVPATPGRRQIHAYGRGEVEAEVVDEADTTLVVLPGQSLRVLPGGHLEVRR
jgi:N-methylhydantoinase A/oxoprolinase/acetone carboxylase beta subunit